MEEIWKDIQGYEGIYQVSNLGNVKSLNYRNRGYAQNLVPKTNNKGRLWVELAKNRIKKPFQISRLVAETFVENPEKLPIVNHKDENPKNNRVDNLEWCTLSYNVRYSIKRHPERTRKGIQTGKRNCIRNGKLTNLRVYQLTLEGEIVREWDNSTQIKRETGMSDWSISECCRGNRSKAYGFRWQYAI